MPERSEKKRDITPEHIEDAGKGKLDDELLPREGEPVKQEDMGGDTPDSAGQHGEMAVETAKRLRESEE